MQTSRTLTGPRLVQPTEQSLWLVIGAVPFHNVENGILDESELVANFSWVSRRLNWEGSINVAHPLVFKEDGLAAAGLGVPVLICRRRRNPRD